jgi:hypothetical protein
MSVIPDPRLGTQYCITSMEKLSAPQNKVATNIAFQRVLLQARYEQTTMPSGTNPAMFVARS